MNKLPRNLAAFEHPFRKWHGVRNRFCRDALLPFPEKYSQAGLVKLQFLATSPYGIRRRAQDFERFARQLDRLAALMDPDSPCAATACACLRAK